MLTRMFIKHTLHAALLGLACAALAAGGVAQKQVSDEDVTSAVETEFWSDQIVNANSIDTNTNEGIVTLTGTVPDILTRERAETIASCIVGVRGVVNRIKVKPAVERSDEELARAVEGALLQDPAADSYEVETKVANGVITLKGSVDSWAEKRISAAVAKGVKGVKDVKNAITVDFSSTRPDVEIQHDIERRLANDVLVDDYLIKVEVEGGKVMLTGTVGSLAEKNRAHSDALVTGVKSVDVSGLDVEWWARDKQRRKSAYVSRPDEKIEKAVKDAFLYDPRVYSFHPEVEVDNGTVTLRGVVDNATAKKAAEEDARNVVGVWRVRNHLKVRPKTIPANEILEDRVSTALLRDPYMESWKVDVNAIGGTIYLSGTVDTSFKKQHAESIAGNVKGVVGVVNNLAYDYQWTWKPDAEIKEDVKDELWWSAFVDSDDINVSVEDGVVTLSGEADTWSERMEAEKQAYEGGAKDVINRLTVTYPYYSPHLGHYPYYFPPTGSGSGF